MPNTNHVIDLLLGKDVHELSQVQVKVPSADLELLRAVFPEAGVQTYLTGHFYQKLAAKLRAEGIHNVIDRVQNSEFKTLQDLIDHVQIRKPTSTRRRSNS